VAAFSLASGNGLDDGDRIWTQLKTPSTPRKDYITLIGYDNCYWSYNAGTKIALVSYPYTTTYQPTVGGNITSNGYSTVKISDIPPEENLLVRIVLYSNESNELWLIDDFKITGIPIPLASPSLQQSTAISHEGFTAHWSTVQNATDYLIQVSEAVDFTNILQTINTGNTTLVRISNLDPGTTYYYRIQALSSISYSNIVSSGPITTLTSIPGNGSNTSIAGANTLVSVPAIGGFSNNNVEIDPVNTANTDFSVSVSESDNSLVYSISTADNTALNGSYKLNHAGFGAVPSRVFTNIGTLVSMDTYETFTQLEVSGIIAKGTLKIYVDREETLPVELSAFTVMLNATNGINILWVSQSETALLGYYLYRGLSGELALASRISPLIMATNTSQPQTYLFTDAELDESGTYYYWLQACDLDGSDSIFGPTTIYYDLEKPASPNPALSTGLTSIYPNPFNPNTTINYEINTTTKVIVNIYNIRGQLVRSFFEGTKTPNRYKIIWDGTTEFGHECGSGNYLVEMTCGQQRFLRKVVLAK